MCIYIYIYICIWLNIIDIFCQHIFLLILSNCQINFMIFGGNWLIFARLWIIIRGSSMYIYIYIYRYKGGWKSSYDDIIFAVNDFFRPIRSKHCNTDKRSVWSTRETILKRKLFRSHSMRVSWSGYELFSQPQYTSLGTFHGPILVSPWTFQPTLL